MSWIVCQIGAREHYAVARALKRSGELEALVSGAWVPPRSALKVLDPRLGGRFHPDLSRAHVLAYTGMAILRDGIARARRRDPAAQVLARNAWFQKVAVAALERIARAGGQPTVFAYSYAARDILAFARRQGWRTVLGQIDPGPAEARIVHDLFARHAPDMPNPAAKPDAYWDSWREETALADHVVVNSDWSRRALEGEGVPPARIAVVPLAYEREARTRSARDIPERFDAERPLRVLFLGQIILRKGAVELAAAAKRLAGAPVEFHMVGAAAPGVATFYEGLGNVVWHGPQPRSAVGAFYDRCDLFVLPTHSDGFALTQWEAIAAGCPVVASRRCGEVVEDGRNGLLLEEVSDEAICRALDRVLGDPTLLARLAEGAATTRITTLDDVGKSLLALGGAGGTRHDGPDRRAPGPGGDADPAIAYP